MKASFGFLHATTSTSVAGMTSRAGCCGVDHRRTEKQRGRVRRGHLLGRGDAALRCRYVTALHCSGRPTPANLTRRADPHAPVHHRRPCLPRNRPVDDWGRLLGQVRSPQSGAPGSERREVGVSAVGGGLRRSLAHGVLVLRDIGAARRCLRIDELNAGQPSGWPARASRTVGLGCHPAGPERSGGAAQRLDSRG